MADQSAHSTGRGGAGNIGRDAHVYADAGIVRQSQQGAAAGEYSSGRGGAGNIVHPEGRRGEQRTARDVVPELALREQQENFHTGRGGEGNVHRERYGGHSHDPNREGLGDRIKHLVHPHGKEGDIEGRKYAE